jgi:hypothetical protein
LVLHFVFVPVVFSVVVAVVAAEAVKRKRKNKEWIN